MAALALTPDNELVTVAPYSEFRGVAAAIPQPALGGNIHDVGSNHIAALTRYNGQGPGIQYREPQEDRDIVEAVYRWDERPYQEIFQTGFRPRPRDEHITSLQDYYDLERHVNSGGAPADCAPVVSVFVSTTRSTTWLPQVTADTILYRYEIFAPGGIDTVLTIPPDRHKYPNQQEIAFVGGISPQYIRTARPYFPLPQFSVYAPFGVRIYRNGLFNPNPTCSNEGQTTQEFMKRLRNVRCGGNMMINLVFTRPQLQHQTAQEFMNRRRPRNFGCVQYLINLVSTRPPQQQQQQHQHRIQKRDAVADTTTTTPLVKEVAYVDPICSVGHYIECAFNFSNSKEAYLFIADRCLHINYAPNDKIINGPMSIGYGFPYLRDTIFASGIDAAFTTSRENEACIFRNNIYALINFADRGGYIIQGPKKITDSFHSLIGTIFEHGIDAAFASSIEDAAYIFKGDQCALIDFAPWEMRDYIFQGPKRIALSFNCLKGTIFQDGLDAAFSSTTKNEAYIFKGNTYALIKSCDYQYIKCAPGTTYDFINIEGPTTPISDGFRSLKDIIPMYPRGL